MFRTKRGDTTIGAIEHTYGIQLNARRDMLLRNLLEERGFDSLTQLLQAYRGRLDYHARRRRIFLSFHAEDLAQVGGFRLMVRNPNVEISLSDASVRVAIDSIQSAYVKRVIREKIRAASIVLCLIGNGTAWRDFVDWELETGRSLGKGLCGVRLKGSRGRKPDVLDIVGAPIASWDTKAIIRVIECAAARRS